MTVAQQIAACAQQAGVGPVTHVPGFGASETFAACQQAGLESLSCLHEEVALGIALGSALTGRAALSLIKMHGLLKAANALVCGLSHGVRGACVIAVFDDPSGAHSDNVLNSPTLLDGLEVPWMRGARSLPRAFQESQQRSLPVVVLIDSDEVSTPGEPLSCEPLEAAGWHPDPTGHLVCPLFGTYQRERLVARLSDPPRQLEASQAPQLPSIDHMPERWQPTLHSYRPWFEAALAQGRPAFIAGDTGLSSLFGLEPLRAVDALGWMGGRLPLALGALAGGAAGAWAVTGDFSFAAAGVLGWIEARRRHYPLRVLLFENGCARATGGQPVEPALLEGLLGEGCVRVERPEQLKIDGSYAGPLLYRLRCGDR